MEEMNYFGFENGDEYEIADKKAREGVDKLNSNLIEQKMLGWTVPSECPIQNEVSGNQFIQKVGRIKFDDVTISDIINNNTILRMYNIDGIKKEWKPTIYLDGYISETPKDYAGWSNANDKTIGSLSTYEYILIKDISCGSIDAFKTKNNGKYIYYELETPITINIDGNEVTERINDSLGDYGLNNKFDGSWSNGSYDGEDSTAIHITNKVPCNGNETVRLFSNKNEQDINIHYFDSSLNWITYNNMHTITDATFVTPSNAKYVGVTAHNNNGISVENAPSIKLYVGNEIDQLKNDLGGKVNFDRLLYANVSCEADQWTVIDNSVNWFQLNVIPILKSAYQNSSGNQAGGLLRINANTGAIEFKPDVYCDWVLVYLLKV